MCWLGFGFMLLFWVSFFGIFSLIPKKGALFGPKSAKNMAESKIRHPMLDGQSWSLILRIPPDVCINISDWWFQTWILFSINIWDVILPIDELIFFNMGKTTNQMYIYTCNSGNNDRIMYAYIYPYTQLHVSIYIYIYVHRHIHIYVCTYIHMWHMCIIYIYIYTIYIYIYTEHIHTYRLITRHLNKPLPNWDAPPWL